MSENQVTFSADILTEPEVQLTQEISATLAQKGAQILSQNGIECQGTRYGSIHVPIWENHRLVVIYVPNRDFIETFLSTDLYRMDECSVNVLPQLGYEKGQRQFQTIQEVIVEINRLKAINIPDLIKEAKARQAGSVQE